MALDSRLKRRQRRITRIKLLPLSTITNQYYIPNLLAFSAKNSYFLEENGFHVVKKLPDKLLKTAQISSFVPRYRENQEGVIPANELIHNNEDLNEFRTPIKEFNRITKYFNIIIFGIFCLLWITVIT